MESRLPRSLRPWSHGNGRREPASWKDKSHHRLRRTPAFSSSTGSEGFVRCNDAQRGYKGQNAGGHEIADALPKMRGESS
jgi:hypothetical protein